MRSRVRDVRPHTVPKSKANNTVIYIGAGIVALICAAVLFRNSSDNKEAAHKNATTDAVAQPKREQPIARPEAQARLESPKDEKVSLRPALQPQPQKPGPQKAEPEPQKAEPDPQKTEPKPARAGKTATFEPWERAGGVLRAREVLVEAAVAQDKLDEINRIDPPKDGENEGNSVMYRYRVQYARDIKRWNDRAAELKKQYGLEDAEINDGLASFITKAVAHSRAQRAKNDLEWRRRVEGAEADAAHKRNMNPQHVKPRTGD